MRYRGLVALFLVAAIVAGATSASALDGTRKGFILGFGIGPSVTSWSFEVTASAGPFSDSFESDKESNFGLGTDFKIGGGITEKFLLYYVNRVAWFSYDWTLLDDTGFSDIVETVTFAYGVGLLGASYYLQPEAPSLYFTGMIGLSTWDAPFEDGWGDAWFGGAVGVGLGYEFAKHWYVEGSINGGNPSVDYDFFIFNTELSANAVCFMVTAGGMLY